MRRYGDRKTRHHAGHSDCPVCHPAIKGAVAKARRENRVRVADPALDRDPRADRTTRRDTVRWRWHPNCNTN